ncbi:MAG TPA: asparaginase [Gemmatimonadaceae bacterium]
MKTIELDVAVTRGGDIESMHRVHAAVVDAAGRVMAGARDPELVTHWRSCAKMFQVMPLLQSGGFDELKWGDAELTLSCASHGGEPEHVAIADRMLRSLGLEEGDLACGPHEPMSARGVKALRDAGERPTRLHNNCSGKHAAMLGRAKTAGWKTSGYERRDHPVQESCLAAVAKWTRMAPDEIGQAVDGCGVVEFSLPLTNMASAFARLAVAMYDGEDCAARIYQAIRSRPFLLGGSDRFDSILIEETDGRVISKVGAEGVHSVAIPAQGIGFAIKVEDGAQRAQYPAVIRMLQYLDALPEALPERLAEFGRRGLRNTRGECVGEVRSVA